MFTRRSCNGVSLKTQLLYLVVFLARYINTGLFSPPVYNIIFKFFYIFSQIFICVLMLTKLKKTYEKRHDTFQIIYVMIIMIPIAWISMPYRSQLAWFSKNWFTYFLFSYSLWIESVAIFPQLFLLQRSGKVDVLNREYVFFLSIYRLFYVLNWIYKMVVDSKSTPNVVWITGILQTLIYSDFIYYYIKMRITGRDQALPF